MIDKSNDVCDREHPGPLAVFFVPNQELVDSFAYEDVDSVDQTDCLVDRAHG